MDGQWNSRAMNSFAAAMNSEKMRRQSLAEKGLEQLGKRLAQYSDGMARLSCGIESQ